MDRACQTDVKLQDDLDQQIKGGTNRGDQVDGAKAFEDDDATECGSSDIGKWARCSKFRWYKKILCR